MTEFSPPAEQPDYTEYPIEHARRSVNVQRTDGTIDKGWIVSGEDATPDGTERYVVVKYNEDGSSLEKRIPKTDLDTLQSQLAAEREAKLPPVKAREIGSVAIQSPDYTAPHQPISLNERIAAGWNVPRSELHQALRDAENK